MNLTCNIFCPAWDNSDGILMAMTPDVLYLLKEIMIQIREEFSQSTIQLFPVVFSDKLKK
jgi:hypothetical protein